MSSFQISPDNTSDILALLTDLENRRMGSRSTLFQSKILTIRFQISIIENKGGRRSFTNVVFVDF